ncbi:MAG: phosphatidylglycerophosphatase A [Bdellovibrionales bacterium]
MNWVDLIATGFYFGKAPKAPGTFGTIVGIPLVYFLSDLHPIGYGIFCFGLLLLGIYVCDLYEAKHKTHDPGEIVIDEIVGYAITMFLVPASREYLALGFLLFRFFDILKPFPIGAIDKKAKGGFGVMADDVIAGIFANILLQFVINQSLLEKIL